MSEIRSKLEATRSSASVTSASTTFAPIARPTHGPFARLPASDEAGSVRTLLPHSSISISGALECSPFIASPTAWRMCRHLHLLPNLVPHHLQLSCEPHLFTRVVCCTNAGGQQGLLRHGRPAQLGLARGRVSRCGSQQWHGSSEVSCSIQLRGAVFGASTRPCPEDMGTSSGALECRQWIFWHTE